MVSLGLESLIRLETRKRLFIQTKWNQGPIKKRLEKTATEFLNKNKEQN